MPKRVQPDLRKRRSGVLLHVTSLPGPHGTGDLGPEAYAFVDWLHAAGQSWWQVLPTGPIDCAGSPYSGFSAFALNPYLIALPPLAEAGWLDQSAVKQSVAGRADRVNYSKLTRFKTPLLREAAQRFFAQRKGRAAYDRFCVRHADWLDDDALFFAIRESLGRIPWWQWDKPLRDRRKAALRDAREALSDDVDFFKFTQFIADRQWSALRKHARKLGVGLIGDLPIFVAHDSTDVWANRTLFDLNKDGTCRVVSGAAPDNFSATGQLWGHPLYRWAVHRRDGYAWWTSRFARLFELFDVVRIDHFLGFNRYWEVPGKDKTARRGKWKPGPRDHFFETVLPKLKGQGEIIAEDLGVLVPEAERLRDAFGFPGMRVIQFGFDGDNSYHMPHNFPPNSVAYTGTHDNDTLAGWLRGANKSQRRRVRAYTGGGASTVAEDLTRAVFTSPANLAMVPAQDVLGLPRSARMNVPGTVKNNWRWRLEPGMLGPREADKLRELTSLTGRL